MLDGLRDLFLSAILCHDEAEANRLVEEWNEEIERLQKLFDMARFSNVSKEISE